MSSFSKTFAKQLIFPPTLTVFHEFPGPFLHKCFSGTFSWFPGEWPPRQLKVCTQTDKYTLSFIIPAFFEEEKGIMCYRSQSVSQSVRQQFTSISSYTIDATIIKPICMILLCIQMVTTYLKFFSVFQFWNNSDFSEFTEKCNFSVNFDEIVNFFKCMGGGGESYTTYIKRVLWQHIWNFSQFWNNSDFSDFTQKCNFSVNYS